MSTNILQTAGLTKHYGRIHAVENLSLNVAQGNIYGILGPNGSGKTTTLGMVLGIIYPKSGIFTWFDGQANSTSNRRIGALLEVPNFYTYLSAQQNLRITAIIKGIDCNSAREQEIERVLRITGLWERRRSKFRSFSLGMKQRLALAAVLLGDPDVLVLDEPANGLDPQGIAEVRDIILDQAQKGKTILLASHILAEVEKVCSHVAIMKQGQLLAAGPVDELLIAGDLLVVAAPDMPKLHNWLKDIKLFPKIVPRQTSILLQMPEDMRPEQINQMAFEQGIVLSRLEARKKSLEAHFLELTQ